MAFDDFIASERAAGNGEYKIEWKAEKPDRRDRTAEVYAKFDGNIDYRESRTIQYMIKLIKSEREE
jgi:hypothetical protein